MSFIQKVKKFLNNEEKINLLFNFVFRRKLQKIAKIKLCRNIEKCKPVFGVCPKILVSLTSIKPRFEKLPIMLKSILFQSVKPDKIIVWLDVTPEMLTPEMRNLEKYGVEYRYKVENLKPHKKYFFALQEFSDYLVITVDDDLVYPPDLIESLYKTWKKHPDCVCARRVHKIIFNDDGLIKPYNEWQFECTSEKNPSDELFATGVGGVLYPPHIFDKEVFDEEKIKTICLEADDVWLKWHELRLGVKVVWAKNNMIHPPVIDGSQKITLSAENVQNNKNDFFIQNCQKNIFELNTNTLEKDGGGYKQCTKINNESFAILCRRTA